MDNKKSSLNFGNEFYIKLSSGISQEKEDIVKQRLKELGIEIDLESEPNRRFKRLLLEHNGNEQTLWYNDGSETGLRVVTFVEKISFPEITKSSFKIFQEIKTFYY